MIGLNPGPRARTVKPGPRHLRTRPDPGQNRLGPHKGIPSGEARQCTQLNSLGLPNLLFFLLLVLRPRSEHGPIARGGTLTGRPLLLPVIKDSRYASDRSPNGTPTVLRASSATGRTDSFTMEEQRCFLLSLLKEGRTHFLVPSNASSP